ncbi:MAG: DUF3877 family protein [Lachnospiraceae bacterium]|nr:DUF3877 family protein [Lachnospiraceae bacterium]
MDFSRLEKNICDVVKEEQIKLGYQKEKIYLYYPLHSLNRLLKVQADISEMLSLLECFRKKAAPKFGEIEVSNKGERFCFLLPQELAEYVYKNYEENPFLEEFISLISKHGISMDEVLELFSKYSDCVVIEKKLGGEFDYLVYFEDGKPDDFRYCLTDEGGHIIYHRFTIEDYEDFNFSSKKI